ncbi:NADH-quinone oxidoreductase subunit C [Kitasatospora sp. NPDC050543]|uniref:NADH-quinone oxidoreductase subunit C n=1 Tax=Kitasatospora sp. NPDC050543 TaxID=3364054 RepID=UPI0037ADAC16
MSFDRTPEELAAAVGEWATGAEAYGLITLDVPAEHWIEALTAARDTLGLSYFDWLSAVDELADGFSVSAHLAAVDAPGVRHLLVRTRVPRERAALASAVAVYAGAGWHERETNEMFGIDFTGHPHLVTLLLPDGFEGHPLRKEFVLAARVAKAWPGAKEPGESDHGDGPARRKMQPAGVPDPNEWGPLKGTLPPVAERPARGARAAGGAARTPRAAAGDGTAPVRPARAARAVAAEPGAAQPAVEAAEGAAPIRADRPRRTRSISEGSVSQAAEAATEAAGEGGGAAPARPAPPGRTRSSDAPWHSPVPAHDPAGSGTSAEPTSHSEAAPVEPTGAGTEAAAPPAAAPAELPAEPVPPATPEPGPEARAERARPAESAEPGEPAEQAEPTERAEPGASAPPAARPKPDESPTQDGDSA